MALAARWGQAPTIGRHLAARSARASGSACAPRTVGGASRAGRLLYDCGGGAYHSGQSGGASQTAYRLPLCSMRCGASRPSSFAETRARGSIRPMKTTGTVLQPWEELSGPPNPGRRIAAAASIRLADGTVHEIHGLEALPNILREGQKIDIELDESGTVLRVLPQESKTNP